jgi:hypothetical protein
MLWCGPCWEAREARSVAYVAAGVGENAGTGNGMSKKTDLNSEDNAGHIAFCETLARKYVQQVADALADGIVAEMRQMFLVLRSKNIENAERLELLERAVETLRGDFDRYLRDVSDRLAHPRGDGDWKSISLDDIRNRKMP